MNKKNKIKRTVYFGLEIDQGGKHPMQGGNYLIMRTFHNNFTLFSL
jgi:hypothetical protein